MSNAFANEFDAVAHAAFLDSGLADECTYKAQPGATAVDAKCYVDRDLSNAVLNGLEVQKDSVIVRLLREGIADAPRNGGTISVLNAITEVVETFTIARRIGGDESIWVLLCQA